MAKIKVLYDARWILVENRFDGVSRYTTELARAMAKRDDLDLTWMVYDERQLEKLPKRPHLMVNKPDNLLKEFFGLARTINKSGHTLLYDPFFAIGTIGKKYKMILTVHDLIYYKHRTPPHWLPWYIRLWWWLVYTSYTPLRWQLNKTEVVATVSETARQQLIDAKATKRDIITVPNAVGSEFLDTTPRDHYNKDAVVYMGAFTPYKNVECLIDALKYLPEVTLHLCGKVPPARLAELQGLIAAKDVAKRVVFYDGATDEQYKEALKHARCAVSASRMEGFGLPLIEAQQAGIPFACADTPIFHEVGQDSVLYFDPESPEDCAKTITQFADLTTSNTYIERGFKNAARYTWDNSAKVAATICKEVAGKWTL